MHPKRGMAGPKSSLRNLWEGQQNLLMSHTAHHEKVSSKAFPELDLSLLPLQGQVTTLSTDYRLFSHMWEKYWKFTFFFLPPLKISYLRTRRSMCINSEFKGPLSALHAIRNFLINYQKMNMMYAHHIISLTSHKTKLFFLAFRPTRFFKY